MSGPVSDIEVISIEGDGGRSSILVEPRPAARDPEILLRTRLVDPEQSVSNLIALRGRAAS